MKKKDLYLLALPLLTIVLEALPWGAVLVFADPEGAGWRCTYPYFSLTPFGYANFGPLVTAVLTCVLFIVLLLALVSGKQRLFDIAKGVCYVSVATSLGPLLIGLRSYSLVGGVISVLLFGEAMLLGRRSAPVDG